MEHHSTAVSSSKLRSAVGVAAIGGVIRRRLGKYGHVQQKGDADWVKGCTVMVVEGTTQACGKRLKSEKGVPGCL